MFLIINFVRDLFVASCAFNVFPVLEEGVKVVHSPFGRTLSMNLSKKGREEQVV